MKKVLIIREDSSSIGGIQNHCNDLCQLLSDSVVVDMLSIANIKTHNIPLLNKKVSNEKYIYQIILDSKCDIVHIHGFASFVVVQAIRAACRAKKEVVYSPHYHPFEYLNNPLQGKLFFKFLLKPILKNVSKIVAINNEDTAFFKKYHSAVIQIPHWIEDVEEQHTKRTDNMILFVGRNDSNKGLEHLYQLPCDKYEIHCVTRGTLDRKDFIQHIGISKEELDQLYRKASILVVPSRYEAFSLVALEALSRGCPVVLSDRVRIADHLPECSYVKVFKYHDFKAFSEAVDHTIGQMVDIATIKKIFNRNMISEIYEESVYRN